VIIPSIDIARGRAVQLVGGERLALEAGDPRPLAQRFGRVGEIAVIDLDAARGTGSNAELIAEIVRLAPCRVGGGIRDLATARAWLDRGATRVVLGTAAEPALLSALPRERVIVALDARGEEVQVEGWTRATGQTVAGRMAALRELAGGFLVTAIEREGRLAGIDLDRARALVEAARPARVTIAGGVATAAEIAALDDLGADAQIGMALYTGRVSLAAGFAAPLAARLEPPWPTVIVDESGRALGLAWSDVESLDAALERGAGIYHSRRRGLWVKGETSGARQDLVAVGLDCDRDALRFMVRQHGSGFCHDGTWTCWGADAGLARLARRLRARRDTAPAGSYTRRLLDDPDLLAAKLVEEAGELAAARGHDAVAAEAADVLYFVLAALARADVPLAAVERELDRRSLRVTRRPGDAKPAPGADR
jgi:phosphoribosyl-ATP pyrophosphohydrolase